MAHSTSAGVSVGAMQLRSAAERRTSEPREAPDSRKSHCKVLQFECRHTEEGWSVEIGAFTYDHGHRSVEMIDAKALSKRLARLEHGLRLSVLANPACDPFRMVELQQARVKSEAADSWSTLHGAEQWDLDAGAGVDVFACLRSLGAGKVARRSAVTEKGSTNRGPYVALCTAEDWKVPVAAYVLTRVLPIHRQFRL